MAKIKRLPQHLANQIAAGEVVERPASVVKELIENAIDASASQIEIVLKEGGKELIEVFDNGIGMTKEDLELCIEPHTTSKIYSQEDLFAIKTLGFRGEALASIASVSRFSIASKPKIEDAQGWEIRVDFGRIKGIQPSGCPIGTIVQVKDIFLEIPARFKFLKSAQSEYLRCLSVINLFCVAWPEIGFKLKKNKKVILNKRPSESLEERVELLLGEECLDSLLDVKGQINGATLYGFIGKPDEIRLSSRNFYFFLNRRSITNPVLWKAVNEAFKGFLVKGNYPTGILFLDIDPELVDINVHPSKNEVRFERPQDIFKLIYHSIKNSLEKGEKRGKQRNFSYKKGEETHLFVKEEVPLPWEQPKGQKTLLEEKKIIINSTIGQNNNILGQQSDFYLIGQFANSYIIYEKEKELFILDQHAAHEAIIFKRLLDEFEQKGDIKTQRLLFPIILDLLPDEFQRVISRFDTIKKIGIELEEFGPQQIRISGLPEFFSSEGDHKTFVLDLLRPFMKAEVLSEKEFLRDTFSKMACGLAIKANTKLQQEQMVSLIKEVYESGVTNCPHGRPIFKTITLNELERDFFRR